MVRILLLLAALAAPLRAGTGSTALPFLKTDAGARAAAMGGAYAAFGDDAGAVFYNPASAGAAQRKELTLGHNEWLEGIRNENLAYVQPVDYAGAFFGAVNALFSGSMKKYDAYGSEQGSFSSMEGEAGAGYAARLGDGVYGGLAVKSYYQKADSLSAMAWGGDAGLLKLCGDEWRFGASAANFGTGMKLGSRSFALPLVLRAGAAWTYRSRFSLSADAVKPGESGVSAAAGSELKLASGPDEAFYLRAGYRSGRSENAGPGWSAGFGLMNGDLRIDYAFAPYGELGAAHRVNLSLRFGAQKQLKRPRPSAGAAPSKARRTQQKKDNGKKNGGDNAVYFMW